MSFGEHMDEQQIQRQFYRPICSEAEIDRIFDVKNTADYLLKLRADTAVDHMRLFRVLRNRYLNNPTGWTLTGGINDKGFKQYASSLDPRVALLCSKITAGHVFSNDPNGACMHTPYGDLIIVSNSLEYFLFYMNMAYLDFGVEVPIQVRLAAQRIATRTMLKTEALDFEMDPRGIIPKKITRQNNLIVAKQMRFIIGHEYAHHIKGHLDRTAFVDQPLFAAMHGEPGDELQRFYNHREKQELEADELSLLLPRANKRKLCEMTYAALLWFTYLDLHQQVASQLFPTPPWAYRTHPEPIERLWNLFEKVGQQAGVRRTTVEEMVDRSARWKAFFNEDVAVNTEAYEVYGSVYLDKPNTKWRGRELKDRVDYY